MSKTLFVAIAAASALAISAVPATATAQDDATIVFIFDQAHTVDIETGNLAAKLGVTPTAPADNAATTKAHAETMARLNKLSGAEFDHAFLQYEVSFHQSVIDAINTTLLPAIDNAELKALVVKVAPAFEGHRLAAERLDAKLSKK